MDLMDIILKNINGPETQVWVLSSTLIQASQVGG